MDVEAFQRELPGLYGGDLAAPHPVDRRFKDLMADVPGMATENKLALLNLAGRLVGADDAYLEVGSFKGLSIIAAALGNEDGCFYAIESFRGFGVDPDSSERELRDNLERWGLADRVTLVRDDGFRTMARPGSIPRPVGAYFYDGTHDRLAHYLALGMAEPLLADEALVIIDDAARSVVARATDHYVRSHQGFRLLFDLQVTSSRDPAWWDGLRVYGYRRPPRAAVASHFDLAWRRSLYLGLYEPVTASLARMVYHPSLYRAVTERPRLLAAARRVTMALQPRIRRS
jgi:predicted O-methyltransferase YrrM